MKKIYILLMHTNTIPARLIQKVTNYKYSHVGIALQKDCNVIYSFGRKKLHSFLDAGFCVEYKDGEFFKTFHKTMCTIYEVPVTEEQYEKVKDIIHVMLLHSSQYQYDFIGIVLRFFGIPLTFKNKYVCSYFVASVLQKAKIYQFQKRVCFIKPKDFENLRGFREIYTGRYLQYQ